MASLARFSCRQSSSSKSPVGNAFDDVFLALKVTAEQGPRPALARRIRFPQTSNLKPQTSNLKLQTSNFKLRTSNFLPPALPPLRPRNSSTSIRISFPWTCCCSICYRSCDRLDAIFRRLRIDRRATMDSRSARTCLGFLTAFPRVAHAAPDSFPSRTHLWKNVFHGGMGDRSNRECSIHPVGE